MKRRPYKIAIVGPESTGKSSLAQTLAEKYQCTFVPEVARDYLTVLGRPYQENDLLEMAKLQCEAEDALYASADKLLFCDTTLLVIRIWSEIKYGHCHPWIRSEEAKRRYDFTLLTHIDLPWADDPLREHPNRRTELFNCYREALLDSGQDFGIVEGLSDDRLSNAVKLLQSRKLA